MLVVGDEEVEQGTLQVKHLDTGKQEEVASADLLAAVREVLAG